MQTYNNRSRAFGVMTVAITFLAVALAACDNGTGGGAESTAGGTGEVIGKAGSGLGQSAVIADAVADFTPASSILAYESSSAYGGRLIMGTIGEPSNLIPPLSSDAPSGEVNNLLYIGLLEYDKDFNIVLKAAESWEVLDEGRHMRFKLRDGLVWQDGAPLTADDVTFTYELMINPDTPTAYAADYLNVKEYRQTGPLTFEVWYEAPFARAAITWMHAILPRHILENENIVTTAYARNPVGAGPFRLKSWESGSRITLEANDLYFEGRPYLDEIIYRIIPDLTTMFLEARVGNIDYLGLTPDQYLFQTNTPDWEKNWNKYRYLALGYTYLGFNLQNPMFADVRVRQALSYAVNREAIITGALFGQGEPTIGPFQPGSWVYNDAIQPYEYNLAKSRAMLAEAGWTPGPGGILQKDGAPFAFTILVNQGNEQRVKVATIIQALFKDIGVKVNIRTVEWAAFLKEFVHKGNYEALILSWNILPDPDIFDVWHSSAISENGLNFVHFNNPESDELLEKARATADQAQRKIYYDRFQEILHQEQPYLFLFVPYALPAVQVKFQGISPAPAGISHNLDRWWIPKELQ